MKKVKQGLAAIMAALFMVPSQPVMAATRLPSQAMETSMESRKEKEKETASSGDARREDEASEEIEALKEEVMKTPAKKQSSKTATSADAKKRLSAKEEVKYNTGNHVFSIVSEEDFLNDGLGDAYFEEDGSYTIHIPEANPFFPYEVEFTYNGQTESKWFMHPEDEVEIGGHTFYVSAYFDGNAVTQMSLEVGGDTVIVYPEKKKFSDDNDKGTEPMSLLPLETRRLEVDLTAYTPLELTMVKVQDLFAGTEMADGTKVIWEKTNDNYIISSWGDKLDLSYGTCSPYDGFVDWEMIVGKDDQLAADNLRYWIKVKVTPSEDWLMPTIYAQDSEGKRVKKELAPKNKYYSSTRYEDYNGRDERSLDIVVLDDGQWQEDDLFYVCLDINESLFEKVNFAQVKAYEGSFASAEEAMSGKDITDMLFHTDMTQKDAGYPAMEWDDYRITMVAFDADGNIVGCLPFYFYIYAHVQENYVSYDYMVAKYGKDTIDVVNTSKTQTKDGVKYITQTLYKEYAADQVYYLEMSYRNEIEEKPSAVIAAYAGKYASIQEAEAAGAEDIKDELFSSPGYGADYSKGVFFSIFAGEDGVNAKETYYYMVQSVAGTVPRSKNSSTWIDFYGLNDSKGNYIYVNIIDEDSYADRSYLTILVDESVDLSSLAPEFYKYHGANLYAAGSKEPEISGKSYHDFSKGPVQYTISAEDGIALKNIWLQIVKAGAGNGSLYINSLADEDAKTKTENGIIYSTREMVIDGRYDYRHDIVLINLGEEAIPAISVDLVSDEVELDKYWTLKGDYALPDINNGDEDNYGETWNLAKVRIKPKEGAADGREIKGTLTIKSEEKELIVLTLTGTVGDPSITTKEIPEAVKYVPYGTMIQNSNKYDWNQVSYRLIDGKLPEGMIIRQNGEIYGVPKETGDFTFTVRMRNSYSKFSDSERTFTLTIIENTDDNVDNATDQGYTLTQRVQGMSLNSIYSQTLISDGTYGEFVDIFLDGEKLEKGVDYSSEEGSTRITLFEETLKKRNTTGRHTLGIEFRTGTTKVLKRAAQNYEITTKKPNNNSGSSSSSSSSSSSGGRRNNIAKTPSIPRDPKKGYYNTQTGILTGEGDGYSRWSKDEFGWKLIYADGTLATGTVIQLADGTDAEQVLWEQVNGVWYAFGITGSLKSGWVFDYQLNGWYCMAEYGMCSGWYGDEQDHCVYYLEPGTGKLATGWKNIDGKWFYFNETSSVPTWNFNAITGKWEYNALAGQRPYGAEYINEQTPDGYFVGIDGAWDGQEKS